MATTSYLYHCFGLVGYTHLRTEYQNGRLSSCGLATGQETVLWMQRIMDVHHRKNAAAP